MRLLLYGFIVVSFIFLLSGCVQKSGLQPAVVSRSIKNTQADTIIFRLAEQAPADHPAAQACMYFANLVEQQTHGKIRIKVYCDGKLGTVKEVFEQLKFGGIALGWVSFADLVQQVPSLDYDAKKNIRGPLACRPWIKSNTEKLVFDCQTEKMYPLAVFSSETRCFYSNSPLYRIRSLYDLKNIRIGMTSSSLIRTIVRQYGAVPVDIVSQDTYQSMHNGYMNVRESELSDFILSNDYSFCRYVAITDYVSNPDMIIMSSEVMNDITVDEIKILLACAARAEEFHHKTMLRFYDQYMPEMKKTKTMVQVTR